MTGRTIPMTAEWALRGKTPDDLTYRILACSDGDLRPPNFTDALDRFSAGTLETLPQVSVSYLARADQVGGSYLALAIRELADGQWDAAGREVIFTRFYCVPYAQLATEAIRYQAMYEAVQTLPRPACDGPPVTADVVVNPAQAPPAGDLAYQAAALLLTGRPVCVLGADRTSVADRLRFVDAVMSLLPYGVRSRMSASTWTSSTYQTHRFRLFFTDAPRVFTDTARDHVLVWEQPERTQLSAASGPATRYLKWLRESVQGPVLQLAEMTGEAGFGARQVLQLLDQIGVAGPPLPGSEPDAADVLLECVSLVTAGNPSELESAIGRLRAYADRSDHTQDRRRYQDLIWRHQLLRPGMLAGRLERKFYDALLLLAFGMPLSYEGYCQLENCLGSSPAEVPHRPLLKAIERGGMADDRVTAVVLQHLSEPKLSRWFRSGSVDVVQLITWLAGDWDRPHQARIVCDVTLSYLRDMRGSYDRKTVLAVLREHGFLAEALQSRHAGAPQYQVYAVYYFLWAAYGGSLDRGAAEEILVGSRRAPTPALLGAVLLQLADPAADAAAAEKAYLAGQLKLTEFDPETRARLEWFVPGANKAPDRHATGPPPEPAAIPSVQQAERALWRRPDATSGG